jgi:hypothetical protein
MAKNDKDVKVAKNDSVADKITKTLKSVIDPKKKAATTKSTTGIRG